MLSSVKISPPGRNLFNMAITMATVCVITPVYNEEQSIKELSERVSGIRTTCSEHLIQWVLIDSLSSDNTEIEIKKVARDRSWIHFIQQGEKSGLGSAYALGMTTAIRDYSADFILEMDGDLQHRPEDIPKFLAKIEKGYDYVIGSRFITEGSIPSEWGVDRTFLSKGGNLLARAILWQWKLHDLTSGFKLSRVKGFLDQFDFSKLYSKRHAYKIHLLAYMLQQGAKVCEVPITFEERSEGESKLVKNDILDTLKVLAKIRINGA